MKKFIAIALLGLHLFTIGGHILLYQYAVYCSDRFFNDQISKNLYNVNDLVEIKLPVNMPGNKTWSSFESISGQVQFKNACYNYVKLKLSRDTIYMMCVPNYEKTRLINQNIINARQITDMPVNKKNHIPFGKTYNPDKHNYYVILYKLTPPIAARRVNADNFHSPLAERYTLVPEQPPKVLS